MKLTFLKTRDLLTVCSLLYCFLLNPLQAQDKSREIYVPFKDLKSVLAGPVERIYLPRSEYESLLKKADIKPGDTAPQKTVVRKARYEFLLNEDFAAITATMEVESLHEGLQSLPLKFVGVSILRVQIDGKHAPVVRTNAQVVSILLQQKGKVTMTMQLATPVRHAAAEQSFALELPHAANESIAMTVPGNIEIKSGASVIERQVDEESSVTKFELLPKPGPMSVTMSLNNKRLQTERQIIARSVIVDELNESLERIHATYSMEILQGATSEFEYEIPAGFEVTNVDSPDLERWSVASVDDTQQLTVEFRSPQTKPVAVRITAIKTSPTWGEWTFPMINARGVETSTGVVGLLAERRLAISSLTAEGAIPLNNAVLENALPESIFVVEPGAPPLQILATFYVPQKSFELSAKVLQPENQLNVQTNTILTLLRDRQQASVEFILYPALDNLFGFDVQAPEGWDVKAIVDQQQNQLNYHQTRDEKGVRRLHVKFPDSRSFGQLHRVTLVADSVPDGWLGNWDEYTLETPTFIVEDTYRSFGVIGIRAIEQYQDVFEIRADMVEGAFPLSASDRKRASLSSPVDLAYQYDTAEYAVSAVVGRVPPLFASRLASFFDVQQGVHNTYHEIAINVQRSQIEEVAFSLPADTTPENITITGQAGTQVKQFSSVEQGEQRIWKVRLSQPAFSNVTLGVQYDQQVDQQEAEFIPAFPKVIGAGYQSGVFSVEASPELEVVVETTDGKQVDVGELAVNGYVVGKHRVAAYRYTGDAPMLDVAIDYPDLTPIPAVLIERAELLTYVASHGVYQTVAEYSMLTRADYVRVKLSHPTAVLWSVVVDESVTVKPQKVGDKESLQFLVDLSTAEPKVGNFRKLRIVYEETQEPSGEFQLRAPEVFEHERNKDSGNAFRVESARVKWRMMVPASYRLSMSNSEVIKLIDNPVDEEIPQAVYLGGALFLASGGVHFLAADAVDSAADYQANVSIEEPQALAAPPIPVDDAVLEGASMEFSEEAFLKRDVAESVNVPEESADEVAESMETIEESEATAEETQVELGRGGRESGLAWALEGRNSLNIDLVARVDSGSSYRSAANHLLYEFGNLGGEAVVEGQIVRKNFVIVLSWVVGLLVLSIGILLGGETKTKRRYMVLVLLAAAAISAVPQLAAYRSVAEMMFAAVILLLIYYLIYHMMRPGLSWFCNAVCSKLGLRTGLFLLILAVVNSAQAQQPNDVVPVNVPKNAVVVPYDPAELPVQTSGNQQLLIPLQRYTELFKRAYPGIPLEHEYLPVKYALSGVEYSTSLYEDNSLLLEGRLGIEVFSDRQLTIGLMLGELIIEYAMLDDQPAQMKVGMPDRPLPDADLQQQQAQQQKVPVAPAAVPTHQLFVSGKGHHTLRIGLRMPVARQGGWRIASGKLPIGASGLMNLTVLEPNTELRWNNHSGRSEYRTTKANEEVESSLGIDGSFDFRWRPVIQESLTDRDLTSQSELIVDIQEDGVYADWFVNLNFRNSRRDLFRLRVPVGMKVEAVKGANIRSWEVVDDQAGNQDISVEMLEAAQNTAQLRVSLVRYRPLPAEETDQFEVPVVSVPDSVSQKGVILVRRSPMLDVTIDAVQGLSRLDVNEFPGLNRLRADPEDPENVQVISRENPLGIKPLFSYQFSGNVYSLILAATEVKSRSFANLKTLVRVSPQEITLESMIRVSDGSRPVHQLQLIVPEDLVIRRLSAPGLVEWAEDSYQAVVGKAKLVTVLLGQGIQGGLNVILEGKLERKLDKMTTSVPYLAVLGVESQDGETVLLSDPSFDVELLDIQQGESVAMASMFGWLKSNQRPLARNALKFRGPNYSAKFQLVPRNTSIDCRTFTNVHVTDRAVEETILLEYVVSNAGQQHFTFRLPKYMRGKSVIYAQYVQRVIWEDEDKDSDYVTVKILLEDEVLNEYRVLVQMDRQAGVDALAPIPVVLGDNVAVLAQFVSLESSGDQISEEADSLKGLEKLNRQSVRWRDLTAILGDRISEAFAVTAQDPTQTVLRYSVKSNQVVNRDAAKIRLATTYLAVDYAGTYRAKLELLVDNQTEQFLETKLPPGSRLWAVSVAGEPVKPIKGLTTQDLKIPLVKTEDGELSYLVQIHYAGNLGHVLTQYGELNHLPIIKEMNIVADGSTFVKLFLPNDRRWFGFDGEGEVIGGLGLTDINGLQSKQRSAINQEIGEKLRRANQSSNSFEKIRLFNSLKAETDVNNYATQGDVQASNGQQIEELNKQVDRLIQQRQEDGSDTQPIFDNREQLNRRYLEQTNNITNNAVNQLGNNFDTPADQASKEDEQKAAESQFKKGWFEGKGLIREQRIEDGEGDSKRLYKGNTQNYQNPAKKPKSSNVTPVQPLDTQSEQQQRSRGESGQQRLQQQLRQYQMQQKESLDNRKQSNEQNESLNDNSIVEKSELNDQQRKPDSDFGGGMGGMGGGLGFGGSIDGLSGLNDQMLVAKSTGLTSIAGFVFDEQSLNGQYAQFELEYISATSEYAFSVHYVSESLIETLIRVGVGLGAILVILIGGLMIRALADSTWFVVFVAVIFLPISVFMILNWVFPVLGLVILMASATWLLKLKFASKSLKTA